MEVFFIRSGITERFVLVTLVQKFSHFEPAPIDYYCVNEFGKLVLRKTRSWHISYFFLCTFAATFKRNPFKRIKPVASSWL